LVTNSIPAQLRLPSQWALVDPRDLIRADEAPPPTPNNFCVDRGGEFWVEGEGEVSLWENTCFFWEIKHGVSYLSYDTA